MLTKIKRFIQITFALTVTAIIYNTFLVDLNIVSGGINGISTIIKHLFKIDQSISLFILSVFFLIISGLILGKDKTSASVFASLIYPLLVKITEPISTMITFSKSDLFVIMIFAGIFTGVANGLIYKTGYNAGGLNVLSQILYEKFKIPIAKSVLIINVIIVAIGGFYFGALKVMYSIIFLYINSIVINKILLGVSNNKAFYIITSKEKEIMDYIINSLGHTVTSFEVVGGLKDKKKNTLLTVIPSKEYYRVTQGIKLIDKDAFFVVTDSYEVVGAK